MDARPRDRVAALRASPADGAPRAAPADRRRPGRALAARQGWHPPAGRDAVRGRLDDGRRAPRSTAASCSTTGGHAPRSRPRAGTSICMVELDGRPIGAQSVDAEEFADPPHRPHRVVAGPRVPGSRVSARRCAPRCWASPSTGSARRSPRPSAFLDNAPSNGVSRALGYEENGFGSLAPRGRRARHAEVPDDRRGLALAAAARPRHRGPRRHAATCSAPRSRPTGPRSRRRRRRRHRPSHRR